AHRVSEPTRQRLDSLGLYGIGTIPEEQRVYQPSAVPGQSFAATLLGYVDHDGNGRYGVEAYYDKVLRGTDGKETTLRDLAGNPIVLSHDQRRDPHNGSDLQLGLDSSVQYWAEQAIAKQTVDSQSEAGEIMIMDPHTGAIRAWDNRSHGKVTMQWVLDDSLNNGAIQVMQRIGHDGYYSNLLHFGIGSPTGVDVSGEQAQHLRPQPAWSDVDYATASFGQQI